MTLYVGRTHKDDRSDSMCVVCQSESSAVRMRLLWDTLTPDTDQWPPLYILWRIHSKTRTRLYTHSHTQPHPFVTETAFLSVLHQVASR